MRFYTLVDLRKRCVQPSGNDLDFVSFPWE